MKKILLILYITAIAFSKANAQGCSDAGVCSIHSIKNNTEKTSITNRKNILLAGFAFGKGERHTSVYTPYVEYTRSITTNTSITGKLSFSAISGELGNTNGLSDAFISVNHIFDSKHKWQKSFVFGLKIPFGKTDIVQNGIHLPMPYQTSLGTTDIVFGLNFSRNAFGVTVALQQPLSRANGNRFLPQNYPANPLASQYLPTNEFGRKADVLLRLSYNFNINERFSVRPSFLGIYHLANDSYIDMSKERIDIPSSKGLTANANVFFDYRLTANSSLELALGAPFVVRDKRPDGLTRSFVAAIDYKFSF